MSAYNITSNLNGYSGINNYNVSLGTTRNIKGSSNRVYNHFQQTSGSPLMGMFQYSHPNNKSDFKSEPSAPTIIFIIPTSNQIIIEFSAPISDGGTPITDYEYSLDDGSSFSPSGNSASPIVVTELLPNTSYDVIIRAVNLIGPGELSNHFIVTTDATTPSAPTINSTIANSSSQITINFSEPTSDGGSLITDYKYSLDNGLSFTSSETIETPLVVTGLSPGTPYNVIIRAVNFIGDGALSDSSIVTTLDCYGLNSGLNGTCNVIAIDSLRNVYAGGTFNKAGDTPVNNIAKWNPNTSTWSALGTGLNGTCNTIAIDSSNNVYAGGIFTTAGKTNVKNIAKWDGFNWHSMGGLDST